MGITNQCNTKAGKGLETDQTCMQLALVTSQEHWEYGSLRTQNLLTARAVLSEAS